MGVESTTDFCPMVEVVPIEGAGEGASEVAASDGEAVAAGVEGGKGVK